MRAILLPLTLLITTPAVAILAAAESAVSNSAQETKPLTTGAALPNVSVKNSKGEVVALSSLHRDRPVVLVFFRGGWCPICTAHTQALMKAYPKVKELGAELVGISPDNGEHTLDNVAKNAIPFPILSDSDLTAAQAFGLAFQVDGETLRKYKGFGIDLEKASGRNHHALPVPAVYIVDRTGKIVFAHSDPDYRKRLEPNRILAELEKLK